MARPPARIICDKLLADDKFIALVARRRWRDWSGALAAYELVKFEAERSEIYIYDLAVRRAVSPARGGDRADRGAEVDRSRKGRLGDLRPGRSARCASGRALRQARHSRGSATLRHQRFRRSIARRAAPARRRCRSRTACRGSARRADAVERADTGPRNRKIPPAAVSGAGSCVPHLADRIAARRHANHG